MSMVDEVVYGPDDENWKHETMAMVLRAIKSMDNRLLNKLEVHHLLDLNPRATQ
jgi:hypothetical protein